jgi:hypothetical protein
MAPRRRRAGVAAAAVAFAARAGGAAARAGPDRFPRPAPLRALREPFVLSQAGGRGRSASGGMARVYQNVCADEIPAARWARP